MYKRYCNNITYHYVLGFKRFPLLIPLKSTGLNVTKVYYYYRYSTSKQIGRICSVYGNTFFDFPSGRAFVFDRNLFLYRQTRYSQVIVGLPVHINRSLAPGHRRGQFSYRLRDNHF